MDFQSDFQSHLSFWFCEIAFFHLMPFVCRQKFKVSTTTYLIGHFTNNSSSSRIHSILFYYSLIMNIYLGVWVCIKFFFPFKPLNTVPIAFTYAMQCHRERQEKICISMTTQEKCKKTVKCTVRSRKIDQLNNRKEISVANVNDNRTLRELDFHVHCAVENLWRILFRCVV